MINSAYPDKAARRIKVEGTTDEIELVCWLKADETSALMELYINKVRCDYIEFKPLVEDTKRLGYLYGRGMMLYGPLRDDVIVRVECTPSQFSKPEYVFYVEDQLVHQEFGNEGGL